MNENNFETFELPGEDSSRNELFKKRHSINEQINAGSSWFVREVSMTEERKGDSKGWGRYDSFPSEYDWFFAEVLEGKAIKDYVHGVFKDRLGDLVGMELGGPGRKLFKGFSEGEFKKTVGVELVDSRTDEQVKEDTTLRHEVIKGNAFFRRIDSKTPKENVFYPPSWTDIEKWAKENNGVDVLIERMVGPLGPFSNEPEIFLTVLKRWYSLLSDEGFMLVELPFMTEEDSLNKLRKISEVINSKRELFEFNVSFVKKGKSAFLLRKLPGAPKDITEVFV